MTGVRDLNDPCIFCTTRRVTRRNALAYCARDSFPVSPGHALVIPVRHCASFFDLSAEEIAACMELVAEERTALDAELKPDGYNIGVNVGGAGGQSVLHVHIHLIPRYTGDHPSPQGGIRQIIPWKADYPRGVTAAPLMGPTTDCDCENSLGAALSSAGRSGDASDRPLVTVCFWCGAPVVDPEAADGSPILPP